MGEQIAIRPPHLFSVCTFNDRFMSSAIWSQEFYKTPRNLVRFAVRKLSIIMPFIGQVRFLPYFPLSYRHLPLHLAYSGDVSG